MKETDTYINYDLTVYGKLTAPTIESENITVDKLNGYKINSDINNGSSFYQDVPVIPVVRTDGSMDVGQYIDFHTSYLPDRDYSLRLEAGLSTLKIGGSVYCGTPQHNCDSPALTVKGCVRIKADNVSQSYDLVNDNSGTLYAVRGVDQKMTALAGGSQTVTHRTNVTGEVGTFCESNGKIYNGYEKITNTDCICQVQTAKTLNKKIVGILTSENTFASHGDVLVKVQDNTELRVGDILCPDEHGYGRLATDEELMFMMLHAIPRPKITSINTGLDDYVACFIV